MPPASPCVPEPPVVVTEERPAQPTRSVRSVGSSEPGPVRRVAARHADGLAVLAVLVVSLGSAAWFTRSFYYFQDDFVFIHQAETSNLSVTYLRGSLFQHFSPVSRLLDYALAHWFHSSIVAAHTIELVLLAATVLAFSWAVAELVGRHWWRHLLTFAFAESLALIHLLGWWTATANILPASLFGLLTIAAFLRYRRVGVRWWILLSLVTFALSLCTHEQSWLVVGYLFLFDLLVLAPGGHLRAALARLWREAWIWLSFVVLTVLAMVNYFAFYYAPLQPRATILELIRYVGTQFGQAFAPSAIGLRPLATGWTNTAALVFDVLAFSAIVIVSIYRRPSAWRVWTVFGVGFLANAIMIGANRVGYFGVDFGVQLYYLESPAYLFLLCVGAAFSLDASGAPYPRQRDIGSTPARVRASHRRPSRGLGVWGVTACVVAVGLYVCAFFFSATTMSNKDQSNIESASAQTYFTRLLGQIDAATARGQRVTLVDSTVPTGVVAPAFAPANRLSYALPVLKPAVDIGQLRQPMFAVTPHARLVPVQFHRTSGTPEGLPVARVVEDSGATLATNETVGGGGCFTSTQPGGTITVRLSSPLIAARGWLLIGFSAVPGGTLNVSTLDGEEVTAVGTINPAATRHGQDYILPLSLRTFDAIELSAATVGQHICFSSVDTGTFSGS